MLDMDFDFLKLLIQKASESTQHCMLLSLFGSDQSSKAREYGLRSAKILALDKKVFLKELTIDSLSTLQGKEDLLSTIKNHLFYLAEGGRNSPDNNLRDVWMRYLHANSEINSYHRLFTKAGAFFMKSDTSSLKTGIESKVVPVSLLDFNLPKELDSKMRDATLDQTILWSRISADFEWQKKSLER